MQWWNSPSVKDQLKAWLIEDIGSGDVTTLTTVPEDHHSRAIIHSKQAGIIAGMPLLVPIFELVDHRVEVKALVQDGERMEKGKHLAEIIGPTRALLQGERLALNMLQRLSGIATKTRHFVDALPKDTTAQIADTRKTTPGHRNFEKYAVRVGGGSNHRFGLYDAVLIKDNHIKAAGGDIQTAVRKAKQLAPHTMRVEIEIESIEQIMPALSGGADIIMLDNMSFELMRQAVEIIKSAKPHVLVEASGGVRLERVTEIAATGVDLISVGALTHTIEAIDISLDLNEVKGRNV